MGDSVKIQLADADRFSYTTRPTRPAGTVSVTALACIDDGRPTTDRSASSRLRGTVVGSGCVRSDDRAPSLVLSLGRNARNVHANKRR